MADKDRRTGDSKIRSSKDKTKSSRSKSSKGTSSKKRYHSESKTPPLPTHISIEELLRQREAIKEELQIIAKPKDRKSDNISPHKRKRKESENRHNGNIENDEKSRPAQKNASPEHNVVTYIDSEDEEFIIEQRRKQRKQLVEKLQIKIELKTSNLEPSKNKEINTNNEEDKTNSISQTQTNTKVVDKITDMFSEDDFLSKTDKSKQSIDNKNVQCDNWDDEDGYFKINIGETINKYTIKHLFGQGVFANVVRAQDNIRKNDVAIKIIRNNDLMYKTGLKEIALLKEINKSDTEDKSHCVQLFSHFMHKGHLCLVLECLHMDLRSVLKKYGKNQGINIKALITYSRQLFLALRHLKKIGIMHADIKPDNILVNEKKTILKLCDFGSAMKESTGDLTPYLVSRFYRAPEIILGIPYSFSIDMWSTACTIYEMSTGKILFTGSSNNKMIKCFMDLKGKIPNRLLKKSKFKDQHFNYNNNFLLHKKDEFTGREKVVEMTNITVSRDLFKDLLKSYQSPSPSEEKKIFQLKDILDKMLNLDANQRLSITDCLKHVFIKEEFGR
ncbi:serine/threonine-protein kinase PRP4 homolog [Aricia agestis]|uniref:serine/threonine-protein kinase PRP4 homolog n=1 Tax=Aricia agestis TaxID=91739 RepID=UPI001C20A379|nr:serine/threonine-protein kinase PRP4 homolog [Aricia agestis]XP_041984915.1 serine/threonine-protein kinase PRP4 homolog [Aricia agestis]XP_041984916.1 serine/threonine-protein kinase PRP4 homolog [Aricia agestis]XP_041984917.1 serine/threonine-protein kinase PRP4 homolog [Aricia agestis]XP_041984918.1 serine/threonine-protein kinase PRP4 homolog [Aricia agestis]XP_041984919.1 serine/threonine-protein kinase PRP4 homolog [Aricia agestis]